MIQSHHFSSACRGAEVTGQPWEAGCAEGFNRARHEEGGGRHMVSVKVGKKKYKMLTCCWKSVVCWHAVLNSWGPETQGKFAYMNSFYLWTSAECSEKSGGRARDGSRYPCPCPPSSPEEQQIGCCCGKSAKVQSFPDPCLKGAKAGKSLGEGQQILSLLAPR